MLAAQANDFLITKRGLLCLKLSLIIGSSGAALLTVLSWNLLGATTLTLILGVLGLLLLVIFICCAILLWGTSLTYYKRSDLLLTTAIAFIVSGAYLLLISLLGADLLLPMAFVLAFISGLCSIFGRVNLKLISDYANKLASSKHAIAGNGNRFTLVSIGLTVGAAMVMCYGLQLSNELNAALVGSVIAASALATALLRSRFKTYYENFFRRTLAMFAVSTIAPYPFVGLELKIACSLVLLVSTTINSIILIDAIAQTAHQRRLSPYWIIGKEGAIFMLGVSLSISGLYLSLHSYFGFILVGITFIALQVFIEEQTFPFFHIDESSKLDVEKCQSDSLHKRDCQNKHASDMLSKGGSQWRERIDEVANKHQLSPRQKEVMRLLLKGRDIKYIMSNFTISQATAKTHVYNLYKKLGVHSRNELMDLIEDIHVR
ncbi:MAG: helix-turn-helix transcriptional regulator [Coriobacteriales bacterium]|jgi:DNA-binding CsgD family transcriptional regulator|nr:helix-turn-helix transcriptional regulator [Coriobacteriales bacterium]